eukprot:5793386-Heterocapsa_arctica.AAC.1
MRKERGDISQYGAVRMTKAEAKEMIRTNQRYIHFRVYVTVYEEMEARGVKIQRLGFILYRDWGNETYGDYLKHA